MEGELLGIGAVARELGVPPSTLRSWERRYRAVVAHRGAQGERLYDPEQVATLARVLADVRRGVRARAAHARLHARQPLQTLTLQLSPSFEAPLHARRAAERLLQRRRRSRFGFDLRLVVSELVTNAVLYGSSQDSIIVELTLFQDGAWLRVENRGDRLSLRRLRDQRLDGGRGLEIVDVLAETWSIETGPLGTSVSARIPLVRTSRSRGSNESAQASPHAAGLAAAADG
jgi:DNA-binding transcriptional MerR regulator